jgi:hypothetical protein
MFKIIRTNFYFNHFNLNLIDLQWIIFFLNFTPINYRQSFITIVNFEGSFNFNYFNFKFMNLFIYSFQILN